MWSENREVAIGDVVIIWMTRENLLPLIITPGEELNNRYGVFSHSDLVGLPYGTKVASRNGRGFVYMLRPTPELWTLALPHRTQILYVSDIAFITAWLGIRPGSSVIEAGTGSGSFTHSVARTIGTTGKLYSYEFHEQRAHKARDEFQRHGMTMVELSHQNVCEEGFNVSDAVDAVFLDLPAPWLAIPHAKTAMKKSHVTRICCFSPCMEQVLRTVTALNEAGFVDITMYESLLRPHEVHQVPKPITVAEITAKVKDAERRKEDRRQRQIQVAALAADRKRKRAELEEADHKTGQDSDNLGPPSKKVKEEKLLPPPQDETQSNKAQFKDIDPTEEEKIFMSKPFAEHIKDASRFAIGY